MLHDLVAECVAKHPDEVCLVFDSGDGEAASQQRVTYSQMWQTAMELKLAFESLSIKEQIVGVVLVDSIIVPSVLLGLLSSSCAFHPFNTGGLRYVCNALRKASASWILAHSELTQQLKPLLDHLEGIEVLSAGLSKHGLQLFRIAPNSALSIVPQLNIAYSITTSGTTSEPKVVLVPHACILPNIIDLRNIFQVSIGDRVLLTSSLTFDPSIIDIFGTLTSGACLVIVPTEVKHMPEKLLDIVHFRQAITVMQATPTLIRTFSPSQLRSTLLGPATALRVLALGGEPFPSRDSLMSWLHADNKTTQFYNLYGVTEVSCWASCQHVDVRAVIEREELVSIGESLHETIIKLVVDDTVAETPCADGEGDIWIGSQTRICLISPEVCENIEKDWNSQWTEREQIVWRNTGDRGKLQQDGSILCLGRRDDQVNRHGKRLSLEALEMVCKEVTGVLDCTALLEETNLMVFIIPDSPTDSNLSEQPDNFIAASKTVGRLPEHPSPDESNFNMSIHDTDWSFLQQRLRSHIEDSLPYHYMPTSFVKIAGSFPLTQNGKLDKKQLLKTGREQVKAEMDVENVWSLSQQVWKINLPDRPAVIQETGNFISLGVTMARRILITGASGLLGRACMAAFSPDSEWETLGLAFSRVGENLRKVDLTDPEQVATVVREFKPTVILHSAAERRPDIVEKQEGETKKLNVDATQRLCALADEVGAYVLFISTDYVFDGTKPPYKPDDKPNPLNKYGLSKAAGEKVVVEANPGNVVLRVPVLYGVVENLDESAVTTLFSKVKDVGRPAEMNHYEKRYPTLCSDVAEVIKILVNSREKNPDLTGIFHWSGDEMMTKYDMALTMAELFGISTQHIIADTQPATGAPRPYDCHLDCSRLEDLGATRRTPFKVGIKHVLERYYP